MATYNSGTTAFSTTSLTPSEFNVFGSSRLGVLTNTTPIATISYNPSNTTYTLTHSRGARNYELSNHLGNVLSVVSDRKIPLAGSTNTNCLNVYDFVSGVPPTSSIWPSNITLTNPNQTLKAQFQNVGFSGMDVKMGTLTIGSTYNIEFDFDPGNMTTGDAMYVLPYDVDHNTFQFWFGPYYNNGSTVLTKGHHTFTYTPSSSGGAIDSYIAFNSNGSSTHAFVIDNISICPLGQAPIPVASFTPEIISTSDYYAFGAPMPGRQYYTGQSYRYGFNGKENDRETVGTSGGTQDYGMRIYNPSLGRFLSIDPLTSKFPFYTPYQFAGNKPIAAVDLDGEEESYRYITEDKSGPHIKTIQHSELFPGEEHGSKGTGTLDYTLNNATGKWDIKYRESFGDAHPVRNFLLNADRRYEDKKGFKTLGKDLGKKVAPVVKGAGIISTAVFGPEVGIPLYKAGGYIEDVSNAIEIVSDASEGKGTDVLIDIGAAASGKIVGKATEKLTEPIKDEVRKFAVEAATEKASGEVIDAGKEAAKESASESKQAKKEE